VPQWQLFQPFANSVDYFCFVNHCTTEEFECSLYAYHSSLEIFLSPNPTQA
jgi:hypothetical protein